jgi:hypothetical protein
MMRLRAICLAGLTTLAFACRAEEPVGETIDLTKKNPPAAQPQAAATAAVGALIEQLGAPSTVQREDAEKRLMAIGAPALGPLTEALKSANPEVVARARRLTTRLADTSARPATYASMLPANSILFIEFRDAGTTLQRLLTTPPGKFLTSAPAKEFLADYRKDLIDTDLKVFDSLFSLAGQLNGKALLAIADPGVIEIQEIDPPLLFLIENANPPLTEALLRNLFDGEGDPIKGQRKQGKFVIDEQMNAGTVFGQDRVIHGLTAKSVESFLNGLEAPPKASLEPAVKAILAQSPKADYTLHLTYDGLPKLAEALQLFEADQVAFLETFGFGPGSTLDAAGTFNEQGVHETVRIDAPAGKTPGLLNIAANLKAPKPRAQNQPSALDLVPFQAAMVFGVNGDLDKHAAEIAAALRALDALGGTPIHEDKLPEAPPALDQPTQKNELPGQTRSGQALKDLLDLKKDDQLDPGTPGKSEPKTPDTAKPNAKAPPKPLDRTTPHFDDLKKLGINVQELLELADGPAYVALFPEKVDVTRITNPNAPPADPETIPLQWVFAMFLKDTKPLEKSLTLCGVGLQHRYRKETLNGGTHYIDTLGDADDQPGFWIDGNYVAYGTTKDVLEFATAGVQEPDKRMTARPIFKKYLQTLDPAALFTVFADCEQFFEMPYKLGQLGFDKDGKNHWPDYAVAGPFLRNLALSLKLVSTPDSLQIDAQTPFGLWCTYQSVIMPLDEANLLN